MPPALPVVRVTGPGRKVGKTLLASQLIERFVARGYRVAAVKRSHHPVPPDTPNSDSDRFAHAGAATVLFCGADGSVQRAPEPPTLEEAVRSLVGDADIVIVEGFKDDSLGAVIRRDGNLTGTVRLEAMDGHEVLKAEAGDVSGIADAIEHEFCMSGAGDDRLRALIRRAGAHHGHLCPGVTLGVRMAIAAAAALDISLPAARGELHVVVEVDRCATDAIGAATGCSVGQRNLRVLDHGKMAATFQRLDDGRAVRVLAVESAREIAPKWAPVELEPRHRQTIAYRVMPDELLVDVKQVTVSLPEDARPDRVICARCGEAVSFGRYVDGADGSTCLACAGAGAD